jgi:hypothetical protein
LRSAVALPPGQGDRAGPTTFRNEFALLIDA